MTLLSSIGRYVPPNTNITVKRMTRIGSSKQLVIVNNTDQNPIPMMIQPKSPIWALKRGAEVEDQFTWIVALNASSPVEPDLQAGDVLTGYRGKQLTLRSANRYEGPYPYLGGICSEITHQG